MAIMFVLLLAFMGLYGIWAVYFLTGTVDKWECEYWKLWEQRHQQIKKSLNKKTWDEKTKRFRDREGKFLKND